MNPLRTIAASVMLYLFASAATLAAAEGSVSGRVTGPLGAPVANARVQISSGFSSETRDTATSPEGRFVFHVVPAGVWKLAVTAEGFAGSIRTVKLQASQELTIDLQLQRRDTVTVTADVKDAGIEQPDPAQRVLIRDEILDANPGRPGAPVSIPGAPIETASGGIKAPQYFAPGVAGDHGEPIATFLKLGSYLLPNNLSANAHGNGYSDPNIMVPAIIESVQIDGGAFNVREGDHSVDLAATYVLRPSIQPFATLTADPRDIDLSAGWNWIAIQASYGNGFLDALEHRQQYKFNILKSWDLRAHHLSILSLGYYGQSKIPGLVPIGVPNLHDTIDSRQRDQTHTGEAAVNDVWSLAPGAELQLSGFFRTYNLALSSNFGDGLIRQSEFRTVQGANSTYVRRFSRYFSLMAGLDYFREAPRRDGLDRYLSTDQSVYGPFEKVTANNITLKLLTPFMAVEGQILPWLRCNVGWRRDQIGMQNADLLDSANSFHRWVGVNSPKATLSLLPPDSLPLPSVSFSFGQAFFTNDPRIGTGTRQGSLVGRAHAYQLVASKTIFRTDLRVTLGHVTQEASLAKIDADTGLQFDEGPSRNRYITLSARRYFDGGLIQASFSKADARDLAAGSPLSEAPRLIFDVLGTLERLPWGLHARAEFEQVGRKPLGDSFVSVPVREFRGALVRSFKDGRLQTGIHFQLASGYTGQTTEVLSLPGEGGPFERAVGVYLPSYATVSCTWRFGPRTP